MSPVGLPGERAAVVRDGRPSFCSSSHDQLCWVPVCANFCRTFPQLFVSGSNDSARGFRGRARGVRLAIVFRKLFNRSRFSWHSRKIRKKFLVLVYHPNSLLKFRATGLRVSGGTFAKTFENFRSCTVRFHHQTSFALRCLGGQKPLDAHWMGPPRFCDLFFSGRGFARARRWGRQI